MELRHTHRLFIDAALAHNLTLQPDVGQTHYLQNVLRLKTGDVVRLFNGRDGEWKASVAAVAKRSITLALHKQTRPQQATPDLWLCCAPIKKAHFDTMIEKATELGVTVIQPVLTARTQIREVNTDRCRAIAIEAAEQSDRLTIPDIRKPVTLDDMSTHWPAERQLVVCAEWGDADPIGNVFAGSREEAQKPTAILTGPEGGFAAEELETVRRLATARFVRLGPRILRADTAAIAALSCWQAMCGDWKD